MSYHDFIFDSAIGIQRPKPQFIDRKEIIVEIFTFLNTPKNKDRQLKC